MIYILTFENFSDHVIYLKKPDQPKTRAQQEARSRTRCSGKRCPRDHFSTSLKEISSIMDCVHNYILK